MRVVWQKIRIDSATQRNAMGDGRWGGLMRRSQGQPTTRSRLRTFFGLLLRQPRICLGPSGFNLFSSISFPPFSISLPSPPILAKADADVNYLMHGHTPSGEINHHYRQVGFSKDLPAPSCHICSTSSRSASVMLRTGP